MSMYRVAEFFVALVLVGAAFLLLNPLDVWMPSMFEMSALAVLVAAVGAFAAFMLREKPVDERDASHRASAGRVAFLVGSGVLLVGIVMQSLKHALDSWLVAALVGMVVAKVAWRWWSEHNG